MSIPFLDLDACHAELRAELQSAYTNVMASGRYILGEELERFEDEFAAFCDCKHAIGVGNGLDALAIALRTRGAGPGDEVIVPAHTFIATWLAVVQCGASVVPVDIDQTSMVIDARSAAAACTHRTVAIIPVHLFGYPVDPAPFEQLADGSGLAIIGDAAQSHGASTSARSVGADGYAATYSFYPSKNLGAIGDGGAITTNDADVARRARRLRNYGSEAKHEFLEPGVNSRLDPLQAAFLRVKLRHLRRWNARRSEIAGLYLRELTGVPDLVLPARPPVGSVHAWHVFCVRHPNRDALAQHLLEQGIATQIHYPTPPSRSQAFASLGFAPGSFPVAERACATALSLPIGPHLDGPSVERVIEAVQTFSAP